MTYGRTLDEAREMAIDAIGGYIKSLKKHNESIPNDEKSFITSLNFNLDGHYASPA
ncbi:MAG TPA: type II toxin-antitoxin system HicB family antitoxin [Patescibacteria group bacterium]|nr:type II toxin-antitoxin system HicB family antitoxin [Patescibacteria group bacterium]